MNNALNAPVIAVLNLTYNIIHEHVYPKKNIAIP